MKTRVVECGCNAHRERDAAIRERNARRHQVFEEKMAAQEADPWPFLPADHETDALLSLVRVPVAKVSVVG